MNTAITCLVAAFSSFTVDGPFVSNARPEVNLPYSSGYAQALADVAGDGPPVRWMTLGLWNRAPTSSRYVVRGQSSQTPDGAAYDSTPQTESTPQAQTYVQGVDPNTGTFTGPQLGAPLGTADPFLNGGMTSDPYATQQCAPPGLQQYYDPFSREFQYGGLGAQPYRIGGLSYYDVGYIGEQATQSVPGNFSVLEGNAMWQHSSYLPSDTIFTWRPEFNYRGWSGPEGVPLPGHAYRFASDFAWAAQGPGPWGFQFGFTPQLTTDFDKQLSSDAWLFDGRGMLFFRPDPTLMLVGGVAYWDRVVDRFIPYAGVVWTPDDIWELRLLYPQSRISVFVGDYGYGGVWLYGSAEYHVEAYEIGLSTLNRKDQIQLSDYRFMVGLRTDDGQVSTFIEGGWIIDRQVDFHYNTPDFDVDDGWVVRAGIRY